MGSALQEESGESELTKIDPPGLQLWNNVLQKLPRQEVVNKIFGRLDLTDKVSARSVCKYWNSFVDETLVFSPLLSDSSVAEVVEFGSSGIHIEVLTISQLKEFKYPKEGLGFTGIRKLRFMSCHTNHECEHALIDGISEENLTRILEDYSDVEEISFHSAAVKDIKVPSLLQSVQLMSLKKLTISAFNRDGQGFEACADLLKNSFKNLKTASIFLTNRKESTVHTPLFYEDCYQFIANHADTLDEIDLSHINLFNEWDLKSSEFLIDHSMPEAEYLDLLEKIDNVKVSSLALEVTYYEGKSRFQFGIRLLLAQTTLTKLSLYHLAHASIAVWNAVLLILNKCSQTLKYVAMQGCFCTGEADVIQRFSCSSVKKCVQLKVLKTEICGLHISDIDQLPKQISKLSLGQMLTRDQVDLVIKTMLDLETLKLPQGMSQTNTTIPKVTLGMFKQSMKLPKLIKLTLKKKSCVYKKIKTIIATTPGIEKSTADSDGCIEIKVDRSIFDANSI